MKKILIVGCGRLGRKIGHAELQQGNQVTGLASSNQSIEQIRQAGIEPCQYDLDSGTGKLPETGFDMMYYLAPPPSHDRTDPRTQAFLQQYHSQTPTDSLLISTTGVYGDCHGDWVDENRAPQPVVDRAKRRLDAEQAYLTWAGRQQGHSVVLRVPGIYSADRLPLARIQSGKPVLSPEDSPYSNRIHEDDLVNICMQVIRGKFRQEIFNVNDDQPTTMTDYFFSVADLLGLSRPPVVKWQDAQMTMSPEMMSYLNESRRISNSKLKEKTGITLEYPDLASGLAQCREVLRKQETLEQ